MNTEENNNLNPYGEEFKNKMTEILHDNNKRTDFFNEVQSFMEFVHKTYPTLFTRRRSKVATVEDYLTKLSHVMGSATILVNKYFNNEERR